ncbi:S24 family peptidase [Brevundimonas bullata]
MSGVDTVRLRALLAERKRSARDVSRSAGLGETALKDILQGRSRSPSINTLSLIAAELDVPLSEFASVDEGLAPARSRQIAPAYLPVRHRVAAGLWLSVEEYAQDFPEPPQAVVPDSRYAEWPQWLEVVDGDSMNLVVPAGRYVHVVDALEMGYAPRSGDIVVVERRRMGGHMRERTLKEVQIGGQGVELWPRSSDPKYQTPLALADADETTEVQIVGKVIGVYWSMG